MNKPASTFVVLLCFLLLTSAIAGSPWTDQTLTEGKSEDGRELVSAAFYCHESQSAPLCVSLRISLLLLQNVLEKLQSRKLSTLEKRQSRLPTCEVGASCSLKKGPRFGRLCDCPRGSRCNFFFLRCL
uniref:Uncharacterized protein n=1 Tax=Mastacembelus armatus TaxID=205130 RepID=A0A3Q3MSG1_9TELE